MINGQHRQRGFHFAPGGIGGVDHAPVAVTAFARQVQAGFIAVANILGK